MFQGGTNFGFMNGSNYSDRLLPDVTSYDYDALLTEVGPQKTLYVPGPLIKKGKNQIVIFETEGKWKEEIYLQKQPILG